MSEANKTMTADEAVEKLLGRIRTQRVEIIDILKTVASWCQDPVPGHESMHLGERARAVLAEGVEHIEEPRVVIEVAHGEPTRVWSDTELDVHVLDHDSFDTEYFMHNLKGRSIDGLAEVEVRTNDFDEQLDWQDDPMGNHHGRNE